MKLRTRLIVAFTLLLLGVIATVGVVVVQSSRSVLTNQVDESLSGILERTGPLRPPPDGPSGGEDDLSQQPVAHVVVDPTGAVVFSDRSGFRDDPDPIPDFAALIETAVEGDIITISSEDGSMQYRAFYAASANGGTEAWASPLTEVDTAVGRMLRTLLLAGAGVALIGAAVTWWTLRRGLQPVDRMVETATAIAGGDLSERVPDADPSTELGQLGMALNDMLTQIEGAFAGEAAAQEQLKDFVADASHELRTPIAAIQGYAELYRRGALANDADLENAMRRIGSDAARMQRLVADLLILARIDRGLTAESRPVNLSHLVLDAVTDSRAIESDRPVSFEGPDSMRVLGDEQQLSQVIVNLLGNARMHTPAGTEVMVRLSAEGAEAVLEVVDEGPGIPNDEITRVFDRFYRVDTSRARKSGGSGLGLAIVAAIVSDHGGSASAANGPGRGARFTVRLPLLEVG